MESTITRKRNRRSFAEILQDLQNKLGELDVAHQMRRERLIERIDSMKSKHPELALAVEAVGDQDLDEFDTQLEEQLARLKAIKAAVRRLK
jgi:hypothetical protein